MRRVVVAYERDAGFWTGRLVDRLALHFGDDAIGLLHPGRDRRPEDLAVSLDGSTGLLTVTSSLNGGDPAHAPADVHLPTSLAIRAGLPILAIELHDGDDRIAADAAGSDDTTGVTRFDLDVGELDREADRLIGAVERLLGGGVRVVPSIEMGPTTVPAFVGLTAEVPTIPNGAGAPQKVSTWSEFDAKYGGFMNGAVLPYSVYGWFANGGRECYIVPIQPLPESDADITWRPTTRDYIGRAQPQVGLRGLSLVEDVTTVVLPDLVAVATLDDGSIDLEAWKDVQTAAIELAEQHGMMALLDPPPDLSPLQVKEWRTDVAMYDSARACVYYPWIRVEDALTGLPIEVPPSGHVAGLWAATDRDRGVWRAPANRKLERVGEVAHPTSPTERFLLTAVGINPIRSLGPWDVRPWGSRTLSTDAACLDLEEARLLQAVERACAAGLAWTQFESNDAATRSIARRRVEGFLARLWRAGGLVGDEQADAFVVRCDEATSPPGSRVQVSVGVASTAPGVFTWLSFGGIPSGSGAILG